MSKKVKYYKRLPGRGRSTFSLMRNSLWLGEDHLLHVINRGYTEEYKRFYYRDIQAILLRQTNTGKVVAILLALIAAFFLILLFFGWYSWGFEQAGLAALGIIAGFWILVTMIHILLGPTCVCHLRTVVHFELFPSLHRVRTAKRALQKLKERVHAVQGLLPQ